MPPLGWRIPSGVLILVVLLSGFGSAPAAGQVSPPPGSAPPPFEDGTVLVGFRGGVTDAQRAGILRAAGATAAGVIGAATSVARVPSGQVLTVAADLQRNPHVRFAEPNFLWQLIATPNDPDYPSLWGLNNTGQVVNGFIGTADADIDAAEAWTVTTGSSTIVVGVVDSGIDYTHPDLAANMWSAPTGGVAGCPQGTHGFNAIANNCDPKDDHSHGSHVAGTIGATGNNGAGVVGVNWTVKLMALKMFDANGSGTTADAIRVIDFAVQAKQAGVNVRALNNSWGGGEFSQALLDEIDRARAADILFVAGAGNGNVFGIGLDNDATPFYPCSYQVSNVVCVAATDEDDAKAGFSNYGASSVHLGAPGTNIYSTVPGGYRFMSGTSMATPHVTGSAALVLSTAGTLTTDQLKTTLLNNVDPVASMSGITVTGGRLNVCRAISGCTPTAPPQPPADVTGTITPGGSPVTVTIATTGQNAKVTFSGTADRGVNLRLSNVTIGLSYVSIWNPDGTSLVAPVLVGTSGAYIDTKTLPVTGTYTILVDPDGSYTGSMTLTLGDVPPDVTAVISPGGAAVSVTIATVSQNARVTFSGTAGRRISLKLSGVTIGLSYVSVWKPDGSNLAPATSVGTAGGFVDTRTLPATGTYTILVDPYGSYTGSMTLTLYDVPPDVTGTITLGGAAVTATTTMPGQNATLTFSGSANQRVSLKLASVTITNVYASIKNPDGTNLAAPTLLGTAGGFIDTRTLPATGTYTILVDPYIQYTGSATLTLYNVPADVTGSITPGGPAVSVSTTTPGQNAALTFSGTANQRISLKVSSVTITNVYVSIKNPDGTNLAAPILLGTAGGFIDTKMLPATGTYTILVDPYIQYTGSATLTLYDVPADLGAAVTVGGPSAKVTITTPGQNARLTFNGTAGQTVTLTLSKVTIPFSYVSVYHPDGTTLLTPRSVSTLGGTYTLNLTKTGMHTILIDPQGSNTGAVTVAIK